MEKNKIQYYEILTAVRQKNDIAAWIKFFLEAVIITSKSSIETFKSILKLKSQMDEIVRTFDKKAHNASKLIELLYQTPVVSVNDIIEPLGVSKPTANSLINDFEKRGILREITGYERNKMFIFERYLDIFSKN